MKIGSSGLGSALLTLHGFRTRLARRPCNAGALEAEAHFQTKRTRLDRAARFEFPYVLIETGALVCSL